MEFINPKDYIITKDSDKTYFIDNESGDLGILVDEGDVQNVIMHTWMLDSKGFFRPSGKVKIYLANYILDVPADGDVIFIDGNIYYDYTRKNLSSAALEEPIPTETLYVDGLEVIVDSADYHTKDLWNYNWKLYQGYVIRIEKRKRVFLHKQILSDTVPEGARIRYRFRDKDRLNCTRRNIYVERLV